VNPAIWLRNQATVLSLHPGTRRARQAYFAAGERAIATVDRMYTLDWDTPTARARILNDLAAHEQTMADTVTHCRWNGSADAGQAQVHRASAQLLRLIAGTQGTFDHTSRSRGPAQWEQAFGAVLDAMAGQHDPGSLAELTTRLYIAARPVVGSDVAETITCLRDAFTDLALTYAPYHPEGTTS